MIWFCLGPANYIAGPVDRAQEGRSRIGSKEKNARARSDSKVGTDLNYVAM